MNGTTTPLECEVQRETAEDVEATASAGDEDGAGA
jgi:hypothetical protein